MTLVRGRIVTPTGIVDSCVAFEGDMITHVGDSAGGDGKQYDFERSLIVPGFVDVHMHGLGGYDVFEVSDLVEVARAQAKFGTTGFLPTVASLPEDRYIQFGHNAIKAQQEAGPRASRIIGTHYEGPFVNPERKGGMIADTLRSVDLDECQRYIDEAEGWLKLMTLSPELENSVELVRLLRKHNIVASLGHSMATKEQLDNAVDAGLNHVCHLYNTFKRGTDKWRPGLVEWCMLNDKLNCEVTCDMHHVQPEFVMLTAKVVGPNRFIAITDSMPIAGLPPRVGKMIDGRAYTTESGVGRLVSNGTIVGSIITMNRAFANLVEHCGIDPVTASKFTSTNATRSLGFGSTLGRIEVGRRADMAVLDDDYNCIATFIEGQLVHGD